MIILNKTYTARELAKECGVSYKTFFNHREREEEHLAKFYRFHMEKYKNANLYIFTEQFGDYIPYREYTAFKKINLLQQKIKETIKKDPRQTGSNIARIIQVENEIQALGLQLSTLTVYTRDQLKELVRRGYYDKLDYRWCYLDKGNNIYQLLSDEDVELLRGYFRSDKIEEKIENIYAEPRENTITYDDAIAKIGKVQVENVVRGLAQFNAVKGFRPMKVPVYEFHGFPDYKIIESQS